MTKAYVDQNGISPWQHALNINAQWMNKVGRFYPLGWLIGYNFFYFFDDLTSNRIAHVATVIVNIMLFAYLIVRWTGSWRTILLFIPILLSLFQVRIFYDPITSFPPFMQVALLFTMGNLVCFSRYLHKKRPLDLLLSLFFFSAGSLYSEFTIPFVLVIFGLSLLSLKSFRATLRASSAHIFILIIYIGFIYFLRTTRTGTYGGTEFGLSPITILRTFYYQLAAAFPLNYFRNNAGLTLETLYQLGIVSLSTKLAAILGSSVFFTGLISIHKSYIKESIQKEAVLFGCTLFVLPVILVGLSQRWQSEVGPGLGYLPVYFSYFGLSILATLALFVALRLSFAQTLPRIIVYMGAITLSTTVGAILFITHAANIKAVQYQNSTLKSTRERVERALSAALTNTIDDGSTLVMSDDPWANRYLMSELAAKVRQHLNLADFKSNKIQLSQPIHLMMHGTSQRSHDGAGWVFVSKLSPNSVRTNTDASTHTFSQPNLYLELSAQGSDHNQAFQLQISCGKKSLFSFSGKANPRFTRTTTGLTLELDAFNCSIEGISISLDRI